MLAIYCRTSKNKEEGKDYSIDMQKKAGIDFAKQMEFEYKFFIDEGVSGTLGIEERQSFTNMFDQIKKCTITAVYCFDQSRLERDSGTWAIFSSLCLDKKCEIYIKGAKLDLNDATTNFTSKVMSAMNELYAKMTSEKVKLAHINKAKKGKTHGVKPYGYGKDKDNNYTIIEEELKYVCLMYKLSLEGIGTYRIANILNNKGVPTRMNGYKGEAKIKDSYTGKINVHKYKDIKWRGNTIYGILTNPIYKGDKYWNGEFVCKLPINIVSEHLWKQVNDNLSENKKKHSGRKAKHKYLLNSLMTCHHCKSRYFGKRNLKNNDNAYICKGRREKKICDKSKGINIPKLDNFVIQHLFYSKDLKKLLLNAPSRQNRTQELKSELKQQQKELKSINSKTNKLFKLMTNPKLENDAKIIDEYTKSKEKANKLEEEVETLGNKIISLENNIQRTIAKSSIEAYTENISFEDLRKLVHSLIEHIEIESCKIWDDEDEQYYDFFKIHITFKNNNFYTRFVTSREAMQWMWNINGEGQDTIEEQKKKLVGSRVTYKDYYEDENENLIYKGTFAKIILDTNNFLIF